jgi:[ribosomal protein S5]-alanine N-acetyltransferase
MAPSPTLPLQSQRLILREFTMEDWPAVHAYGSHQEVYRFQAWGPNTPTESRQYVARVIEQAQRQPRTDWDLAIVPVASGEVVGTASLVIRSQEHRQGELGYVLHPNVWRQGYATEAARLLLDFGFRTLGLHRIFATCDPRNMASARVLEKVGMQFEGRLRHALLLRDGWRDSLLYSLLEHEWEMPPG